MDCTGTEPCRLTMNEDKAVTAIFAPAKEDEPPEDEGDEDGVEVLPTSPETVE